MGQGRPPAPANAKARFCLSRAEAWLDMLAMAAREPTRVKNRGKIVTIGAGEFLAPTSMLAARWNWTNQTVRCHIANLEEAGHLAVVPMLDGASNNLSRILRVAGYERYASIVAATRYAAGEPKAYEVTAASVIDMLRGNRSERQQVRRSLRDSVWIKTSGRCAYCAVHLTRQHGKPNSFCIDHVLAVAKGGSDDIANLIPACHSCNSKKGARTALQFIDDGVTPYAP